MTKSDPYHNDHECPQCGDTVLVPLPYPKYVDCQECKSKLEIHPDAEFEDGLWHDRTELSIVDPERDHMKTMLQFAKEKHGAP
jgi:DNA-directed RNA polymerase subunit RPC12/RpoP